MSQYVDGNTKTFIAGGTIAIYDRVYITAAQTVSQAGLENMDIGTALDAATVGGLVTVQLATAAGTCKMRVKEAITAGSAVYTETGGEIQDTAQATSWHIGIALETATAEDDIIEVIRTPLPVVNS